jgi:hypothetical protein
MKSGPSENAIGKGRRFLKPATFSCIHPLPQSTGVFFMSYPTDGERHGQWFLEDQLYDAAPERLRNDDQFQALVDNLFDIPPGEEKHTRSLDDIEDDYNALDQYLQDEYDIFLDDYWNWADYRAEYDAA